MPNAARIGHELTEIRDESPRFARFSLTIVIKKAHLCFGGISSKMNVPRKAAAACSNVISNRNEFLRDSSRSEPNPPNIRNDIVSESRMTRSSSRLERKNNETSRIPPNKKKINLGDSGDSWPVWNRGIICKTPHSTGRRFHYDSKFWSK